MRTSHVEYASRENSPTVFPGDYNPDTYSINTAFVPTGMNTCNYGELLRNTYIFDANQYALATAKWGFELQLS